MNGRLLVVDDERDFCELVALDLGRRGFEVTFRTGVDEALELLTERNFDVVLTDLNLPGTGGLELCRHLGRNRPDLPVVVITAFGSFETAVGALRAGAWDFVSKPVEFDLLALTLQRAVDHAALHERVRVLTEAVDRAQQSSPFESLLGTSAPMRHLHDQIERVADTEAAILITGESGTGKELVARALHDRSRRRKGPFVAVNCAAIPEHLLESELFGHTKGAFTGATAARRGLFLEATGGTLLLDEVGELPLTLQAKLLRVLEERSVRPVGGDREVDVDARLLTATNRDLERRVASGQFREDLLFRINVIHLELPPLRARGEDILLLAEHFLRHFATRMGKPVRGVSSAVAEHLLTYGWPGNVRALRNAIERAVAVTRFDTLAVEDLPEAVRSEARGPLVPAGLDPNELPTMEQLESRYLAHVLELTGGNKTMAARILGFDRRTLYRKLDRLGHEGSAKE